MNNAGKYRHLIRVVRREPVEDADGFQTIEPIPIVDLWAKIDTMPGAQLLKAGVEFEKSAIRFLVRKPKTVISPDMQIIYKDRVYDIAYLIDRNEAGEELELQCREVRIG